MDEIQHYLTELLTSYINVDEDLEEEIVAENDEFVNDDNNIYSDPSELHVGDSFKDWDTVLDKVNAYAKHHGFVASKFHKDLDSVNKSIVWRRVFKCWKFGVNEPKKVVDINAHRNSTSGKTDCPWQISFYLGKRTEEIRLTKFVNSHNHEYDTKTIDLAPRNLRFSQSILDKIEHYTLNGRLGAGQQYDLLLKEFPQYHICKKNLYNAINKF
jgi:hypothetical protein